MLHQSPHAVPPRILKAVERTVPFLEKKQAPSLVKFYRSEALDSKEVPFNSRKHTPERLMLHLPEQLGLAVQTCPPSPPPGKEKHPSWREFCNWKYRDPVLPRSFYELPSWVQ